MRTSAFRGFKISGAKPKAPASAFLSTEKVGIEVKGELRPASARGDDLRLETVEAADDDVFEIEFTEGGRFWIRAADFRERFATGAGRVAGGDGLSLPGELDFLPAGFPLRGPAGWAIKSLKVLSVDLAGLTAEKIAAAVETKTSERRPGLGLFRIDFPAGEFALVRPEFERRAEEKPFLLMIHGTASSTWGSFGDLWSRQNSPLHEQLAAAYQGRALAFEHASLTQSPIRNALDLVSALPDKCRLHLLTHSRGGLVGELLCRGAAKEEEFALFDGDEKSKTLLRELAGALRSKRIAVERFVRVACPALGTTLASGKLDRWMSVIGSLAGSALPGLPLFDFFKDLGDFAAAVVKKRTDPRSLPGLEAMLPDSAFIKLINFPGAVVPGNLDVIAGDIDPSAWWAKFLVWVTDRFYEGDHDLVVNTASMSGGASRSGSARIGFFQGPEVHHFSYFRNSASAAAVIQALVAPDEKLAGWEELVTPAEEIPRDVAYGPAEPKSVVFVLPGIMGSELSVNGDRIWVDFLDLFRGKLEKIRYGARSVTATGVMTSYYGALIKHLAGANKVVPFPYDWRLPPAEEADRLAKDVEREMDAQEGKGRPVRFVAHSMGGLIVRAMIARHEELRRKIFADPGARFLMLGTPNGGSFAIPELLVGKASVLKLLALLDAKHTKKKLLEIVGRFPGVLAMLPRKDGRDFFAPDTWAEFYRADGAGWVLPVKEDLARALETRTILDGSPLDPKWAVYVAGRAAVTLTDMCLDAREGASKARIRFTGTTRGDGKVTWESGIPAGLEAWYMDAVHGALCAQKEDFEALDELLERGTTSLLPRTPPIARAAEVLVDVSEEAEEFYPTENRFFAAALGASPPKRGSRPKRVRPVEARVIHGSLDFARHAVAVGHYQGDTIISAEKALDRALDGALTQRHEKGLYPGPIETNYVFLNPKRAQNEFALPEGAIVVGLGVVGNLSAATLSRSFARALLEFEDEYANRKRFLPENRGAGLDGDLGVSALLIGTGAGGISTADSVFALLQGVRQANETLVKTPAKRRIGSIEFLELWEDRAIQVVKELKLITSRPPFQDAFAFEGRLDKADGGMSRVFYEEPAGWWHRLQILGGTKTGEPGDGTLRFSSSTRRARSEVRLLAPQRALVDRFVEESTRTVVDNRTLSRTLFELLLPNEIKEQAPDEDDYVFLLDEDAARYPWELLEDPYGANHRPFAVDHGLLRQLESFEFRETVKQTADLKALVIGDPASDQRPLEGARREAENVRQILKDEGGYKVNEHLVRLSSRQVMNLFFDKAYRIIHLAGHGAYRWAPAVDDQGVSGERLTGMIIGPRIVLSQKEVRQLRFVPELVFINCCYLGYIENVKDFPRIAANVATEFIRMGVRAVVAAGWPVDDAAAVLFAETFYKQMLAGQGFGKAVLAARKATFDRHPESNTWGAYQCYGDPDFRLAVSGAAKKTEAPKYVSSSEAVAAIDNLAAGLIGRDERQTKAEVGRLEEMIAAVNTSGWERQGDVSAALGRAFREADSFGNAIERYKDALCADDARVKIKDLEELSNLQCRHALNEWKRDKSRESTCRALAEIDHAVRRIQSIIALVRDSTGKTGKPAEDGRTCERLCLLGSAYKRRAVIDEGGRLDALRQMTDFYKEAHEKASARAKIRNQPLDPYPLLNWLAGDLVLRELEKPAKSPHISRREFRKFLELARREPARALAKKPRFWDAVSLADTGLVEALSEKTLTDERTFADIVGLYIEAKKLSSPRELASVGDQIEFLAAVATEGPVKKALAELRVKLGFAS